MRLSSVLALCSLVATQAFLMPVMPPSTARGISAPSLQGRQRQQQQSRVVVHMGRRAAKIAARKGKSDMVKTKIYSAYGKKIIMAVKAGGPEPDVNRSLFVLIREAKANGVPNDNIQRAIQRGSSASEADFKEAVYEAYGYGGAGIIINCLTDNTNRAKTEINNAIKKTEFKMAATGSVAFNFERRGRIELPAVVEEDPIIEAALEADVDDVEVQPDEEEGMTVVLVEPSSAGNLRDALIAAGIETRSTSLVNVPRVFVGCSDEDFEANMRVIEALEALDDVDSVEHNMEDDDE